MITKTKVVIFGSFRKYLNEIEVASAKFESIGLKVLAPLSQKTINTKADFVVLTTDNISKKADVLEKDFMSNIKIADFIYLVNKKGYVGESATAEMCFAIINQIPIITAEEEIRFSNKMEPSLERLLKHSIFACVPISKINLLTISRLKLSKFVHGALSSKQKKALNSLVNKLLENLKHVKI